jgi:hypothetical protein
MNRLLRIAFLALAALALAACNKPAEQAATEAAAPVAKISAPTDNAGDWRTYFSQELTPYVDRKFRRPFSYLIPMKPVDAAEGSPEMIEWQRQYDAQLESVENAVGRGIQAGSILAFAGPDSKLVVDVIEESFKLAGPMSLNNVRIVVIAKPEEQARAQAAVAPSGAEFIFVEMK